MDGSEARALDSVDNDGTQMLYFLTDHLGSVMAVTDASGTLLEEQRYMPFGQVRTDVGEIIQTDFGYTFQRNLPELGLMDYRARMYDARIGRFVQADSIVPDTNTPNSWNKYAYVLNRPINMIDPSGNIYCDGDWERCTTVQYSIKPTEQKKEPYIPLFVQIILTPQIDKQEIINSLGLGIESDYYESNIDVIGPYRVFATGYADIVLSDQSDNFLISPTDVGFSSDGQSPYIPDVQVGSDDTLLASYDFPADPPPNQSNIRGVGTRVQLAVSGPWWNPEFTRSIYSYMTTTIGDYDVTVYTGYGFGKKPAEELFWGVIVTVVVVGGSSIPVIIQGITEALAH